MNEIKCPKCGTVFSVNEDDYNSIMKHIRDQEFEKEIISREKQFQLDKEQSVKIALLDQEKEFTSNINKKELKIKELENELKSVENDTKNKYREEINNKDIEIEKLKNELELREKETLLKEKSIKEKYEDKIKSKDEQIEYYKDFKARQSTKMVGESLEKHCSLEFNKLRPLFQNAYFEKDNDCKSGSKGDFIFRDYDEDNNEFVSIMFEMKNENDETSSKHKNEDFFKELDKDRKEKDCEYAVLVSLLEMDNDYYNTGIVDVSYKYPKMYVIRPQFFIPFITLIRGASLKSLDYQKELKNIKEQNIDISHFEENITSFKDAFGRNYRLASERFKKAIEEIDKTIDHLQKTKDALLSSENNLRLANNKIDDLSINKLTHGNDTMKRMFEEIKNERNRDE